MLSVMIVSPAFAQVAASDLPVSISNVDVVSASAAVVDVDPVFSVLKFVVEGLYKVFAKQAPVIQLVLEIMSSIAMFCTLLVAFLVGILKIPLVISKYTGATVAAEKIQKFYDKCLPYLNKLKKLSMFNATKK